MFKQIFAWWDTATWGTRFTLWKRKAQFIGEDDQGNKYYQEGARPSFSGGRLHRRWVIYHGVVDGSRIPPDWHGWLHHNSAEPPTISPLKRQHFELDHLPNMSGTPLAYHPTGSLELIRSGQKALSKDGGVGQDYEAWSPDQA
ncbi:MAG: NADH:ubiquinone oxidoreductase subunit NDUFA12 [Parvularculaceae bacterium]